MMDASSSNAEAIRANLPALCEAMRRARAARLSRSGPFDCRDCGAVLSVAEFIERHCIACADAARAGGEGIGGKERER